jgi:hypothetical protein
MALRRVVLLMVHARVTVSACRWHDSTMLCAHAVAAHQCQVKHQEHRQKPECAPH